MADRNALARATEKSSSPTPGYLYNDIAKQSATSPSISAEILSYLVRRLAKNNAHIKFKVLKTISMVCQNANSRGVFKRTVVQDMQAIKEIKDSLNYRGRPDEIHGDELYERVRTQAKETLDAVYSDEPSSSQMNMSLGSGSGIGGGGSYAGTGGGGGGGGGYGAPSNGGYGNSSISSSAMGSSAGPKKMEGIGNPMFQDPRHDAAQQGTGLRNMTIGNVAAAAAKGFKGIVTDPLARNIPGIPGMGSGALSGGVSHRPGSMGGYGGGGGGSSSNGWNSAPPGQAQLASSTNGQWTMASNRGPTSISSETYRSGGNNISSGIGGSWGASSVSASNAPSVAAQARMTANGPPMNHTPVVHISGHPGEANTSGTFEKNMIMELCPPGGMKPEPPADKLASFCQSLPHLNSDLICPALLDMLEDGQPWVIRAKVLCVMEKCVGVGVEMAKTSGNNVYADFFHMCHEEITPLAGHSRAAVRDPAKRLCKMLGLGLPAFASNPKAAVITPTVTQPLVEAPNLLDFDEPAPLPPNAPPAPPAQAPPAPPVAACSSGGLFGGMTVKAIESVPQIPAVVNDYDDLLGTEKETQQMTAPSATETKAVSSDMFGSMVLKSSEKVGKENVENEKVTSAPAPAASAFSFMNSSSEAIKAPEAPKSLEIPKSSFDPLLSLESSTGVPSSQQNPMTMTPQMAMVMQQQQQQIMMMQAQMQQMKMGNGGQQMFAMQQRQSSSGSIGVNRNVMGATGGHGVATSFAFMEDPTAAKKETSNKKFDFVQDAMKSAK